MLLSEMEWVLSPFYDLLNVKMIVPKDKEDNALLLGGQKVNLNKGYFDRLGAVLKLNDKQINGVYKRLIKWLPEAIRLKDQSFLDVDRQKAYQELITKRVEVFSGNG